MNIEDIKLQVEQIAKTTNINEQAIFSAIDAFLKKAYVFDMPDDETLKLIEGIKIKILKTIYRKENHKLLINIRTDYNKVFGIDSIEGKQLERSLTELESEGLISCRAYEISLLDNGVLKARDL